MTTISRLSSPPNYEKDKLWCHNLPIDSWDVKNTDTLI